MVDGQLSDRIPPRVSQSAERLREQTSALVHTVAEEAAALASLGTERAREAGADLAERARHGLPEIRERVPIDRAAAADAAQAVGQQVSEAAHFGTERAKEAGAWVASEVAPSLRDLAAQATALAAERWEAARARAATAPDRASSLLKDRAGVSEETPEEILERARKAAEDLVQGARRSADELLARARVAAEVAAGTAGGTVERAGAVAEPVVQRAKAVPQQARHEVGVASRKAAKTGNDTLGLVFWAAAAAGIIWYVVFKPERREQLERLARSAWSQGSELYRDLKGDDEAF